MNDAAVSHEQEAFSLGADEIFCGEERSLKSITKFTYFAVVSDNQFDC